MRSLEQQEIRKISPLYEDEIAGLVMRRQIILRGPSSSSSSSLLLSLLLLLLPYQLLLSLHFLFVVVVVVSRRRPWSPKWRKMEKYKKALNTCFPHRNNQILHEGLSAISRSSFGKNCANVITIFHNHNYGGL